MNRISVALCVLLLSSCGVTLDARKVSMADKTAPTPSVIPGEGIVYALPKTDFEIVQPISISVPTSGPLHGVFETCRRACTWTNDNVTDESCKFSTATKLNVYAPQVRTVAVPDPRRLYQVSPGADVFQSIDFKFDISQNGVLDKADTSASNATYDVVSSALVTAIKAAAAPTGLALPAASPRAKESLRAKHATVKPAAVARPCYQVSNDVTTLLQSTTGTLTCNLLKEIDACMAQYDQDVTNERTAVERIFDKAISGKVDPKLLPLVAEERRQRLAKVTANRNEIAALFGLGEGEPKVASYQIVLSIPGPAEHLPDEQRRKLTDAVTSGAAKIIATTDNGAELLPSLVDAVARDNRWFVLNVAPPAYLKVVADDENSLLGGGYRYRIPTASPVTLSVMPDDQAGSQPSFKRTELIPIAQYGAIAALPAKFKGKGGRVMVRHWPDTGGIQTVEIGAEPLPSSAVTDVANEAYSQYKARRDKAEGADPELDDLTRQQKILSLKKQIKDLQDSLKE